jgi:hypothetical protein
MNRLTVCLWSTHSPITVHSKSDYGQLTVRSLSTHSPITAHSLITVSSQSDHGPLKFRLRSARSPITVSSQSDHGQLTMPIRLFVTVLCLESDRHCGQCCRNTVKNTWLALDWNLTDPVEQIGPISYMDCPGIDPVFCGYETRPRRATIRRRVVGQQHCTSLHDVIAQKTVKASDIRTAVVKQNLQKKQELRFTSHAKIRYTSSSWGFCC